MKRGTQGVMYCPCGNSKVLALGLCPTCYTLKRQEGGHREEVLARDGYRCCILGCTTLKRGKRSVAVHHRKPTISDMRMDAGRFVWVVLLNLILRTRRTSKACYYKLFRMRHINQRVIGQG